MPCIITCISSFCRILSWYARLLSPVSLHSVGYSPGIPSIITCISSFSGILSWYPVYYHLYLSFCGILSWYAVYYHLYLFILWDTLLVCRLLSPVSLHSVGYSPGIPSIITCISSFCGILSWYAVYYHLYLFILVDTLLVYRLLSLVSLHSLGYSPGMPSIITCISSFCGILSWYPVYYHLYLFILWDTLLVCRLLSPVSLHSVGYSPGIPSIITCISSFWDTLLGYSPGMPSIITCISSFCGILSWYPVYYHLYLFILWDTLLVCRLLSPVSLHSVGYSPGMPSIITCISSFCGILGIPGEYPTE